MARAENYYDFVIHLGNLVLEEDVHEHLAYLAAVHAWQAQASDVVQNVGSKYQDNPLIQVWRFLVRTHASDSQRQHTEFMETYNKALAASPEIWMLVEIHQLCAFFISKIETVPEILKPLNQAKRLIALHPELEVFEASSNVSEFTTKQMENDPKGAIAVSQRGVELAEKYDDPYVAYMNLILLAWPYIALDIKESIRIYEKAHEIVVDLGVPFHQADVLNDISYAYMASGEYDLALAGHYEGLEVYPGGCQDTTCLLLSTIYADLGDGLKALEWADRAFEWIGGQSISSYCHITKARALIVLQQHERAESELDLAKAFVMKKGREDRLGLYYYISGLLELSRGELHSAIETLKEAEEVFERTKWPSRHNRTLLALARAELAIAAESSEITEGFATGPWMKKLENRARERDYPGIAMDAAILKADFHSRQGRYLDARQILEDALDISDSPGVRTLSAKISERIKELDRLLREA
ncbi:MAG: tetratricopeptide repeat protein [Candidatus Thorarchaeota archaeon]